jgi:hypothetical protein
MVLLSQNFFKGYIIKYTQSKYVPGFIQHKEEILYDLRGNVVDNDDPGGVGLSTKYQCIYPEKVIFVDETGEKTNQAKNGNRGGQRFIATRHGEAREWCSTKNCQFTALPFTAATGDPMMGDVIVSKEGSLTMENRIGLNAMAQLDKQDELDM